MIHIHRRPTQSQQQRHRYHVRLHFPGDNNTAPSVAVVGSTNNRDDAIADLVNVCRLHTDADILDTVTLRRFTPDTGWVQLTPKEVPPPCRKT